jgi:hypothetical protein
MTQYGGAAITRLSHLEVRKSDFFPLLQNKNPRP